MKTEEIINDLKKYELKHQETRSRLDFVVNDGTVLGWEEISTIINTVESLTKENEELREDKKNLMEELYKYKFQTPNP